mgnify:FL=1
MIQNKASARQIDMTHGSILGCTLRFALPICAGSILQQMYSTVDTLVIGNYCDSSALAAVSTSSQPLEILLCVFLGIGSGISILVSQACGASDQAELKKLLKASVFFLYAAAIPLTALGLVLGPSLLKLMQVPSDAMPYAVPYLRIVTIGILGNMGYNFNAGILRGFGSSGSSLVLLLVSCVVNIVLDLLFVAGLGMGVYGAAWATMIALTLSWLCSIWYIRRYDPELEFPLLPHGFDGKTLRKMVKIGLPLGMNTALYSTGHVILQVLFNLQGSTFVAGCSVAGKVASFANLAIVALSSTMTVFSGQNLGAKNYRRLCRGAWLMPLCAGAATLVAGIFVTIFCQPLLALFTRDTAVLVYAIRYIHIVLPFTWMYAVMNVIMCFANGIGEIRYPTIVNLFILWGVRIPVAYLLSQLGYGGYAMASVPFSFFAGMIMMLFYFRTKRWAELRAREKNEP